MDDDLQARVLAAVDRGSLIDLASRLVRIPSFCPDETPLAQFVGNELRARGYEVEMQEVEPRRLQAIADVTSR